MKKICMVFGLSIIFSSAAYSNSKKIDWSKCSKELKEYCSKEKDDHSKYECLEKLVKDKVSKECLSKNAELESMFSDKHEKGHSH
jgi:hypothetical protein